VLSISGAFLQAVEKMEFDYIASGHYAHVVHSSPENPHGLSMLKLSQDMVLKLQPFLIF
jgi:tRNA-5-taurinomethyluridine 2-sulfurtransferase